jgi:hypothetical protein
VKGRERMAVVDGHASTLRRAACRSRGANGACEGEALGTPLRFRSRTPSVAVSLAPCLRWAVLCVCGYFRPAHQPLRGQSRHERPHEAQQRKNYKRFRRLR